MRHKTLQAFEEIDAAVFSGDLLYTDAEMFRDHLKRWVSAHNQHKTFFDGVHPPTADEICTEGLREALLTLSQSWTPKQLQLFKSAYLCEPKDVPAGQKLIDAYNLARRSAIQRIIADTAVEP